MQMTKAHPHRLAAGLLSLVLLCAQLGAGAAELAFPKLTGRVVDQAEMLPAPAEARINQLLQNHETASTEQLVVATLSDLQGQSIEEYGYQLGRAWGIGQADSSNGGLLIISRKEHKIRIEVGYGLEGRLTDAQSKLIIDQIITPAFKRGQFAEGIENGVIAMIQVLGGTPLATRLVDGTQAEKPSPSIIAGILFIMLALSYLFGGGGRGGGRRRGMGGLLTGAVLGSVLGGGRGGGFGGGGFGGGGGGFGGGGASGGW